MSAAQGSRLADLATSATQPTATTQSTAWLRELVDELENPHSTSKNLSVGTRPIQVGPDLFATKSPSLPTGVRCSTRPPGAAPAAAAMSWLPWRRRVTGPIRAITGPS
ncbi:hypothetical protein ACFYXM_21950 [Streptomyces sp. NPDC002476]|uniref:hypothetical protein n=1 Tax=Streptomyces sp. NPDC002476 TaxID=3364648 RepID=UPI0036CEF3DA